MIPESRQRTRDEKWSHINKRSHITKMVKNGLTLIFCLTLRKWFHIYNRSHHSIDKRLEINKIKQTDYSHSEKWSLTNKWSHFKKWPYQ